MAMTQTAWHVPDDAHYREPHRMPGRTASHGGHSHNLTVPPAIVEGSVVRPKVPGPEMVVEVDHGDGSVLTSWFVQGKDDGWDRRQGTFSVKALEFVRA